MLDDPWRVLCAWASLLPGQAVFAGPTAAWLHGLDADPVRPVEVILPPTSGVRTRTGLAVRHADLASDVTTVRGLHATGVLRTLCDLAPRLSAVETLVLIDGALRLRLIDRRTLKAHRRLLPLAELAAAAESPMETRLRWLLLEAGLPRPEVQTDLRDAEGRFVGRADLYYPRARLVIEYDGVSHRERLVEDNRRQNLLINAGFRLLRFTAADLHQRPEKITALVWQALVSGTGRLAGVRSV